MLSSTKMKKKLIPFFFLYIILMSQIYSVKSIVGWRFLLINISLLLLIPLVALFCAISSSGEPLQLFAHKMVYSRNFSKRPLRSILVISTSCCCFCDCCLCGCGCLCWCYCCFNAVVVVALDVEEAVVEADTAVIALDTSVEPRSNGTTFYGILPFTDTNSWSLHLVLLYFLY